MLSIGAVVVLNKYNLQLVPHGRILIDHLGDPVDIPDHRFGTHITGGGFGAKQVYRGVEVLQAALFQAEVNIHNRQGIHQLPLVLMGPLHLHVKHKVRVQADALALSDHSASCSFLVCLI